MFYFSFANEEDVFEPFLHCKKDLTLLECCLIEKEGKFPQLYLTIPAFEEPLLKNNSGVGFFSYQKDKDHILGLFKGYLQKDYQIRDEKIVLRFEIFKDEAEKIEETLELLKPFWKQAPFYDALFIEEVKTLEEAFAAKEAFVYFDRLTHMPRLSSFFKGSLEKNVGLQYQLYAVHLEESLSCLKVTLGIEWIQHAQGLCEIASQISKKFPDKKIATYTPLSLQKNWPKVGMHLGRCGYRIVYSRLQEKGQDRVYFKDKEDKTYLAEKKFFDAKLTLAWSFRQKRVETLSFEMQSVLQEEKGLKKEIYFGLQKFLKKDLPGLWFPYKFYALRERVQYANQVYSCQKEHFSESSFEKDNWQKEDEETLALQCQSQSSFFLSDRGKKALAHALKRAQALLAKESRCVCIQMEGGQDLLDLTTDHTLFFQYLGKEWAGKISRFECTATCEGLKVKLSVLLSIGKDKEAIDSQYLPYEDQKLEDALALLNQEQMIEGIFIKNLPQEQEKHLQKAFEKKQSDLKLGGVTTKISIKMKSLQTTDALKHHIFVKTTPYFAPLQIELNKEKKESV